MHYCSLLNSQSDNTSSDHHSADTSACIILQRNKTGTFRPSFPPRPREGKLQLVVGGRWSVTTLSLREETGFGGRQRRGPRASQISPSAAGHANGGEAGMSGKMPSAAHRARACTATSLATTDSSGERPTKWRAETPEGGFSSASVGRSCVPATSVSFHLQSEHPCFHTKSRIAEYVNSS